jgi:hypothetical protein
MGEKLAHVLRSSALSAAGVVREPFGGRCPREAGSVQVWFADARRNDAPDRRLLGAEIDRY